MIIGKESTVKEGVVFFLMLVIVGFCFAVDDQDVSVAGKTISTLETAGNVSISRSRILSRVRGRVGEKFDEVSASEDVKRIAKISGIKYCYYNTVVTGEQVKVTYVVIEKNIIRSLEFAGNKAFKNTRLAKQISLKKGDYLDLLFVHDSVKKLEDYYHEKGYANVKIALDEDLLLKGELFFKISEGSRVMIDKITFSGNEALSGGKLASAIDTKKREYIFWRGDYSAEVIEEDLLKLETAYHKLGYLNVKVSVATEFSEDGSGVSLVFTIVEGSIYYITDIVINGNEFFDSSVLLENTRIRVDGIYSKDYGDFDAKKIKARYLEIGYVDATVNHRRLFSETDNSISVAFDVIEGDRFRIGKISIIGNEEVHDNVVRRVLEEEDFVPGQWYNADLARGDGSGELEKFLQRKVMTSSAIIRILPSDDTPGKRDAQVSISEARTGSIMLGAGVASNSGLIGQLVYDQRNFDIFDWPEDMGELFSGQAFKGAGQRFKISANPGTRQSSYSVNFMEPYLYDKPVSFDVLASGFERIQETYDEKRQKIYLGLEKRYTDDWRRGFSFRAESVDVSDLQYDAPVEVHDVKGGTGLYGTKFFIRKDTTDNRFLPSEGYNFMAGYEQVFGDFTFGVLNVTQRWYKTLYEDLGGRKTVLETKMQGGKIFGDAPLFEKYYAGGTSSIRGFKYRGVSPRGTTLAGTEGDIPVGSDWLVMGNAEVAVPITSEVLSWLFFVDVAAIDSGKVRSSVGTGLQILLPQWFGPVPMRFELATPISREESDETRVFSFTVGALF